MGEIQQHTQPLRRVVRLGLCAALVGGVLGTAATDSGARQPVRAEASVVGGSDAQPGSFPSIARIVSDAGSGRYSLCTGTLVAPNVVLTAAHCAVGDTGAARAAGAFIVQTGMARDDGSGERYAVRAVDVHPSYSSATLRNDVALLVLDAASSSPATSYAGAPVSAGTRAAIAGWGITAGGTENAPAALQHAATSVQPDALCSSTFGGAYDPATMLCAADAPTFAAGTCNGDSGGPLLVLRNGGWVLVGVTSWGARSCDPRLPGVYARVSTYAGWISDTIAGTPAPAAAAPSAPADERPATAPAPDGTAGGAGARGGASSGGATFRGRTAQGRQIVVRLGADGRTIASVRFDHRTSCRASWQTYDSARSSLARRAKRGLAAVSARGAFSLSGTTGSGQRFRLSGRFTSARRLAGALSVAMPRGGRCAAPAAYAATQS